MALQEDQLEAIAQRVVARLQAAEPHSKHEAAMIGKKVRARAKGLKRKVLTPISSSSSSSSSDSEAPPGPCSTQEIQAPG